MIRTWTEDAELERYARARREGWDQLGSLGIYFTQSLRRSSFDLTFTQDQYRDVVRWRKEALTQLCSCLALPQRREVRNVRVRSREKGEGFTREEIEFESAPGLLVPATVLVPSQGEPPFPAVVALHDMGGFRAFGREKLIPFTGEPGYLTDFRRLCYEGRAVGIELVRRGYLVISIDALLFGERTPRAEANRGKFFAERLGWTKEQAQEFTHDAGGYRESLSFRSALLTGQTWAGMVVNDDMATVDYLASRADVDAKRIGCVGLSYGAYRTNYLAAIDERISAAVSVCWMATLDSVIAYNVGGAMGWFTMIPGIHTRLDICDIASLACRRPFLAISGWQDELMEPHGIASAHRKLRAVWNKAGAPERLGSLCFDSPHEFNAAMQEQAYAWFERWLKPS